MANVILVSGLRRLEAAMYIDSGADITTLPLGAGQALGFKQGPADKILEMRGVSGGGVPYLVKKASLVFEELPVRTRVAWALIEEVPFLLGRLDIFNRFDVTFQERKRNVLFVSA
ncbi:MAG: hypothetical protein HY922_10545 [Elusimicrobia bacterium]|nr:hypothetical protein [Elusimicrobiota bacterium]